MESKTNLRSDQFAHQQSRRLTDSVLSAAHEPGVFGRLECSLGKVGAQPRLRRALTLRHLLLYGVVVVCPFAPMTSFGVMTELGGGHVVVAILIAMLAMLCTSISYGRMAQAYPSAGSAFAYVGHEIHPTLGYLTGWGMILDYVLCPVTCVVWCAEQSYALAPSLPVFTWKILYAAAFTVLNVQSIRASARLNVTLAAAMGVVAFAVLIGATHYILVHPHTDPIFYTRPFYDPKTFSYGAVLRSTSIAVLTYLGFDAISTLSEETVNPRRNILLATVLTCFVIGALSAAEVYVAQLVWPASERFPNVDTAYVSAAARIWSPFFSILGVALIIGVFAGGAASHLGAARLLYAMGRSSRVGRRFFGAIDPKHHIPRNNVVLIGAITLIGALLLTFAFGIEMVNFGALIAFMGVNAAAFIRYFVRGSRKTIWNFVPPVLGFLICLGLSWNLSESAKILGSIWMSAGVLCVAWMSRGLKIPLTVEELKE